MSQTIADPDLDELPPYLQTKPAAPVVQLPGTARAPEPKAKRRSPVDLERLQVDYCAARLTVKEAGAKHGISAGRVVQLAKQRGWVRDIRVQARIKAAALINEAPAAAKALNDGAKPQTPAFSAEVDQAAAAMAFIRTKHRGIVEKAGVVVSALLLEVEQLPKLADLAEQYERALRIASPKRREAELLLIVRRIQSLPSRIYGIKKLSDAAKNVIFLERQAYDLDAPDEGAPPPPREKDTTAAEIFAWFSQQKPK